MGEFRDLFRRVEAQAKREEKEILEVSISHASGRSARLHGQQVLRGRHIYGESGQHDLRLVTVGFTRYEVSNIVVDPCLGDPVTAGYRGSGTTKFLRSVGDNGVNILGAS